MTDSRRLVDKLWAYCDVLRDDGVGVLEYTEQLTYLLFLKMAHERATRSLAPERILPTRYDWQRLLDASGLELEILYTEMLMGLSREPGVVGTIFRKSQNKLSDPAKLKRVVSLIDSEGPWIGLNVDVKGEIYEGLLERNASEVKSGAGQYFTPRPVIEAIVQCVNPRISETVCDPACGTGGFLLAAYDHMKTQSHDRELLRRLRTGGLHGVDIVHEVVRLCAMNLYLHGVGGGDQGGGSPVVAGDALAADWRAAFSDAAIGQDKTVTLRGSALSGGDSGNYRLDLAGAPTAVASILGTPVGMEGARYAGATRSAQDEARRTPHASSAFPEIAVL